MSGKVCVVTGATAGIGKETALGLAKLGATVVIVARDADKAGRTVAEGEPFDQFCSRAYVDVSRRYEEDPSLLQKRQAVLHAIEEGGNDEPSEARRTL